MDLFGLLQAFVGWSQYVAETWGLLGIFIVSIIGNAAIILPLPTFIIVFLAGSTMNPWMVGIVAGLGGAIGELTAYAVGFGGREVLKDKHNRWLKKAKKWSENWGVFPVVAVFAATPLPFDIVGILSGVIKYDIKRFFIATLIGKAIASFALAWAGFYSISWVLTLFGWV